MRRNKAKPPIKLPIWIQKGRLWYADAEALRKAIKDSGVPDNLIQKRMGQGYKHIQEVLAGVGIDGWAVVHIEYGISEENEISLNPAT